MLAIFDPKMFPTPTPEAPWITDEIDTAASGALVPQAIIVKPIIISGKRNNAVLIAEDDWNSIQETLYLCSIPGMRESILEASKEPLEDSVEDIGW